MHESRGNSPADTAAAETLGATLAYRVHDEMLGVTEMAKMITADVPRKPPEPLPHPSGHRTRADHARLKAKRKRGRKGRNR